MPPVLIELSDTIVTGPLLKTTHLAVYSLYSAFFCAGWMEWATAAGDGQQGWMAGGIYGLVVSTN